MANGFGGVFTWELTQDTNYNHALSINRRIDNLAAETPLLELNNANSGSGALGTGVVHLGSGGVLNNGLLRFARDGSNIYSNVISGSGRVETGGTGTQILTGASTYTGGTRVAAGSRMNIGNGGTTGSVAGPIEVIGTLAINRSDNLTLTNALSGTGTFVKSGAGRLTLGPNNLPEMLATFSISGGSLRNTADLTFSGNILIGDAYIGAITQDTGTVTFSTASADWGLGVNIGHRIGGIGRYDLSGGVLNVHNAPVILTSGPSDGTLAITGGTANLKGVALGTSASGTARLHLTGGRLNIGSRGLFNWTPPSSDAVREILLGAGTLGATDDWSSSSKMTLTDSVQGLTIDTNDFETPEIARYLTLSGSISGTGKLTKSGAGSLSLTGASSFTGTTTVAAGTLVLHGSLTSATTVANAAKFRGSGSIAASVTVQSGGILAPDEGATLTTGALTLESGSTLLADGKTAVTGNIVFTDATAVVTSPGPRMLLTYTGTRTGKFAIPTVPSGWQIDYDDAAREVRLIAAPAGYDTWIASYETNGKSGFNDDADNDGISNGLEFLLGSDPMVRGDTVLPVLAPAPGGGFTYNFTRAARARANCTVTANLSDDMLTWPPARDIIIGTAIASSAPGVTITPQGDHDQISIGIPDGAPRTFLRLEVRVDSP